MDKQQFILFEALRQGAGQPDRVRLYRSGKLPGLFPGRTREHAAVADQAVRDGLIEIVSVEVRGKTTVEWARVTPKGIEHLMQHESPVRALQDLRAVLESHRQRLPVWVAELQQQIEELQRRLATEVEAIGQRLDRLAERAREAIERLEQGRGPEAGTVPWGSEVLSLLEDRESAGLGASCSLAELFHALRQRRIELNLKDFHVGLRRLHEHGLVQLQPDNGATQPHAPEYGLLDGNSVYHSVVRASNAVASSPAELA
jgi:hypothetical protein